MKSINFPSTDQPLDPSVLSELPKGDRVYTVTKIITNIRTRLYDEKLKCEKFRMQPVSSDKIGCLGMFPVFSSIDAALAYCGDPDLVLTLTAK
jgi:hypothetical protein